MPNMTKFSLVSFIVVGCVLLTGCGVSRAFTEAKEAMSSVFATSTPTEQLNKYEEEVLVTYPVKIAAPTDDATTKRIAADNSIKRNSALIVKCDQLLEKMPPLKIEKNDPTVVQERRNIETRRTSYIASLKDVIAKAKTEQLAVSVPTGSKFLPEDHEVYTALRDTPSTAAKQ